MAKTDQEQKIREAFEAQQLAIAGRSNLWRREPALPGARLPTVSDAREVFSMVAEDMWKGPPTF